MPRSAPAGGVAVREVIVIVLRLPRINRQARRSLLLAIAALLLCACGAAPKTAAPVRRSDMASIFEAPAQLLGDPAGTLALLRRLGVDRVRVFVPWNSLAPQPDSRVRPSGFDAASPAAYPPAGWAAYDAIIRAAAARGVGVILTLEGGAPLWAAGRDVPGKASSSYQAVWKPSASEYGEFVHAVAVRYSGGYRPGPGAAPLPRVDFWSVWNEPNYGPQLAPQAIDYSTVEVSPRLYRGLLDAAWSALQATGHGSDRVLIGELAPRGITTGDNPGNFSGMVPLRFVRALYCVDPSLRKLRGSAAAARGCPTTAAAARAFPQEHPALFQATGYAVHPYPQGGIPPNTVTPDEPDYADLAALPRLERLLDRLQSIYGSAKRFPLYSTEFGYQTNPPETIPRAIDPRIGAVYSNWAEYLSWRDPRIASWDQYLLTDPPAGNFATGLLFATGAPKALYYAYRMPIFLPVSSVAKGQSLEVWGGVRPARYAAGESHRAQRVKIELRPAGQRTFTTLRDLLLTDAHGYFDTRLAVPSTGELRLAWTYPNGEQIFSRTVVVTVR
ncbi:MAG: hypothetical protein JO168_27230 [Solirubrobacterales bacterium]|nr:hypothetical protein [Solirubrobacterales bacterium]